MALKLHKSSPQSVNGTSLARLYDFNNNLNKYLIRIRLVCIRAYVVDQFYTSQRVRIT